MICFSLRYVFFEEIQSVWITHAKLVWVHISPSEITYMAAILTPIVLL
jgi:hypothetical protein